MNILCKLCRSWWTSNSILGRKGDLALFTGSFPLPHTKEPGYEARLDLTCSTTLPPSRNVAAIFGAGILLKWMLKHVWQLSGGFCAFFLAPWGVSRTNLKKYGPWAGGQASSHVSIPLLV